VAIWARGFVLLAAGAMQTPGVYNGLEITVKSVERARNVSLQDCPPGDNIVRGVIRPGEENEFATVCRGETHPRSRPWRFRSPSCMTKRISLTRRRSHSAS
jgi:hypothetical protein